MGKLPEATSALSALAAAAITGVAVSGWIGLPREQARLEAHVVAQDSALSARLDAVADGLEIHRLLEYPQLDRRVEFLYCRELERAGEAPSTPCLELIK